MTDSTTDTKSPVATVFARVVRPGFERRYEEWLAGIAQATSRFPGSQGTTILRPNEDRNEYLAIAQFDSAEHLAAGLDSAERAACTWRARATWSGAASRGVSGTWSDTRASRAGPGSGGRSAAGAWRWSRRS